jgi:hypothetical protein
MEDEFLHPADQILETTKTRKEAVINFLFQFVCSDLFMIANLAWIGLWVLASIEHYSYGLLALLMAGEIILLLLIFMYTFGYVLQRTKIIDSTDFEFDSDVYDSIKLIEEIVEEIKGQTLPKPPTRKTTTTSQREPKI